MIVLFRVSAFLRHIAALIRKVLEEVIADDQFSVYRYGLFNDIADDVFRVYRTPAHYLRTAENLLMKHGKGSRLRTLNALQLAVAIDARNRGLIDCFVSSDTSLCHVAKLEGFRTIDPVSQA